MGLQEKLRRWRSRDLLGLVLVRVTEALDEMRDLKELIMATAQELRDKMAAIQVGLDGISTDVQSLKDIIAGAGGPGLNAAETEEVSQLAQGILDRVTAIDQSTP